jgi:hypothetical protein
LASGTAASSRAGSISTARRSGRLVAGGHERVGLGRHQRVEEALDLRRRLDADELVGHLAALERLHGRDPLDAERLGQARVGVGVDLGEDHLTLARARGLLEHRCQRAARATPFGPEVHDDRRRLRALEDLGLEGVLGDVDDHAS